MEWKNLDVGFIEFTYQLSVEWKNLDVGFIEFTYQLSVEWQNLDVGFIQFFSFHWQLVGNTNCQWNEKTLMWVLYNLPTNCQ